MTTYTKLRDESWGLRVEGRPAPGQKVTVTKKNGEQKTETIGKVLWQGPDVALCTIYRDTEHPAEVERHIQPGYRNYGRPRRGRTCSCDADCCRGGCHCDDHCVCRGGNIYDC